MSYLGGLPSVVSKSRTGAADALAVRGYMEIVTGEWVTSTAGGARFTELLYPVVSRQPVDALAGSAVPASGSISGAGGVATNAMLDLGYERERPSDVLADGHDIQVSRVGTRTVPTKVVYRPAIRDLASIEPDRDPMHAVTAIESDRPDAVPGVIPSSHPWPAGIRPTGRVDAGPVAAEIRLVYHCAKYTSQAASR